RAALLPPMKWVAGCRLLPLPGSHHGEASMFSVLATRLLQLRRALRPQRRPRPIRQRRPLWCEQLEDRTLLSIAYPTLSTTPGPQVVLGSGQRLTDSATLAYGNNPTGTLTFKLLAPDGVTVVDSEPVNVTGNGTYVTPTGYIPMATGTYHW